MEKIKRGSLVLPKGTTAARVKRKKLADAVAKRREAKAVGQEAGVFIARARKAKIKKEQLTAAAKETNNKANSMKKAATARKISRASGGGYETYVDGTKNPMAVTSNMRKSKYTPKQIAEIPKLEKAAGRAMVASKGYARRSGGTATGIKRTAEAAIGRIAQGKALKKMARAGGALGIATLFAQALKGTETKKK